MPNKTIREVIHDTVRDEMRRDPNVILMGEDVEQRRAFIQRNAKDVRFLDI